jgi:hypothetical protein
LEELEFLGLGNFREWSGPSRGGIWHFWNFLKTNLTPTKHKDDTDNAKKRE